MESPAQAHRPVPGASGRAAFQPRESSCPAGDWARRSGATRVNAPLAETSVAAPSHGTPIGFFERYLTIWVLLCIAAGTLLGHLFPSVFATLGGMEVAHVNLPVAVLIWLMIVPMLLKIDFHAL